MPRALPKVIVLTSDTGLMIAERNDEVLILDRDGVTLGKIPSERIGGIRNWLSDFNNRMHVNARRDAKSPQGAIPPHAFVGKLLKCTQCGFQRQHRAHRV